MSFDRFFFFKQKTAYEMFHPAPICERAGKGEENEIAAGNERRRQPARANLDGDLARERGIGNGRQRPEMKHVILAEPFAPRRLERRDAFTHALPRLKLGAMALLVIEAQRLDASKTLERPRQAHG